MSNELTNIRWPHALGDVTENKSRRRTGTFGEGQAWELIGFDSTLNGGLRPSAGFLQNVDISTADSSWPSGGIIGNGDFRTFSVRVDASTDVSGYVYRVRAGSNYEIRVLWYYNGRWDSVQLFDNAALINAGTARWSVTVFGRAIFVYIKGVPAKQLVFTVNDGGTSASTGDDTLDTEIQLLDRDTPAIKGVEGSPTAVTVNNATDTGALTGGLYFGTILADLNFGFGGADPTTLQGKYASHHEFGDPKLPSLVSDVSADGFYFSRFADDKTGNTGNRSPQVDTLCTSTTSNIVGNTVEAFASRSLLAIAEGAPSESPIAGFRRDVDVRITFQLISSSSGRTSEYAESAIIPVNRVQSEETVDGQDVYSGNIYLPLSDATNGKKVSAVLAAFEGYVSDEWDRIKIYRSVRYFPTEQSTDPVTSAFYVVLDESIANLTVKSSTDQTPVSAGKTYKRIAGILPLSDTALLQQEPLLTRVSSEREVPRGGAARIYESSMFVSDITGNTLPNTSVGEIRYSSLLTANPATFFAIDRFIPDNPRDTVIRWQRVGGNLIGFSRNRQYLSRIEGSFVKFEAMHDGFGILSDRAVASVSELCFFATPKGLKVVDSTGSLNDYKLFDSLVIDQWAGDWDKLQMVYDPQMSALFMLNPVDEHMAITWFNNSTATELLDCRFVACEQGNLPNENDGSVRAIFCRGDGKVYTYDYLRTKTDGSSNPRVCLNDTAGDLNLSASSATGTSIVVDAATLHASMVGTYLYVAEGPGYGTKTIITAINDGTNTITTADDISAHVGTGTRLTVDPVYCRWVGGGLIQRSESGQQFAADLYRVRTIEHIAPYWMDVSGPSALTDFATYRGLAYRGNSTTPEATAFPLAADGTAYRAIRDGSPLVWSRLEYGIDGTLLFPGIEIICADFDFTLLSVMVTGKIKAATAEGVYG